MVGVAGIATASLLGFVGNPASAASFAVPSPINVTNITATSFDLQVGKTGTVRTYEYSVTGGPSILSGIVGTAKATLIVKQNTSYSLKVREVNIHTGAGGPFSAAKLIQTPAYVPPAKPSTPGNLAVASVSQTSVVLSWTSSTDPTTAAGTLKYRYFLDGKLAGTGGPTGATVTVSPGTTYAIQVDALNTLGVRSDRASLTVTTPGTATPVSRPTAPANVHVTRATQNSIGLDWDRSSDPQFANTQLQYRVFVDGVPNGQFDGYQGCNYCFLDPGFTGGGAIFLSPQTSYTIGIAARNPNGVESPLAIIVASTTP